MNSETLKDNSLPSHVRTAIIETGKKMPKQLIDEEDSFVRLKLKINNLLWEELPAGTTIGTAESMACDIMCHIQEEIDNKKSSPNQRS